MATASTRDAQRNTERRPRSKKTIGVSEEKWLYVAHHQGPATHQGRGAAAAVVRDVHAVGLSVDDGLIMTVRRGQRRCAG